MNLAAGTSRYAASERLTLTLDDDRAIAMLARRIIPPAEAHATYGWHRVRARERLDLIAAERLGDPELWWRLADANPTLDPDELVALVGTRLRVTLPAGLPVADDA